VSARCDVCGKEPRFGRRIKKLGKNAQHRFVKSRKPRRFNPNIQISHTVINGTPTRLRVCTSCLKKGDLASRAAKAKADAAKA
jgi:large subunit ribosomal protein L28